jgi:DNA-binding transcriptional regulator YhcF (GntR family)
VTEHWATRTGRWRQALREQSALPLEERLYGVIRSDIQSGALPGGALLPTTERVAAEMAIDEIAVQSAFARLLWEGLVSVRGDGVLCIASGDVEKHVGEETQIRFEESLLKAMREAQARGLSSTEATGMFKAALQRLGEIEQEKKEKNKGEDD